MGKTFRNANTGRAVMRNARYLAQDQAARDLHRNQTLALLVKVAPKQPIKMTR